MTIIERQQQLDALQARYHVAIAEVERDYEAEIAPAKAIMAKARAAMSSRGDAIRAEIEAEKRAVHARFKAEMA